MIVKSGLAISNRKTLNEKETDLVKLSEQEGMSKCECLSETD